MVLLGCRHVAGEERPRRVLCRQRVILEESRVLPSLAGLPGAAREERGEGNASMPSGRCSLGPPLPESMLPGGRVLRRNQSMKHTGPPRHLPSRPA